MHPVWQAVDSQAVVDTVLVTPAGAATERGRTLLADAEGRGASVTVVSDQALGRISERDDPSGIAAIVRPRLLELTGLTLRPDSVVAALHETANPGNVGTIVRTLDAVGASGVVLVGKTTDPWSPAAVKASMGTVFHVDIALCAHVGTVLEWARASKLGILATSAHANDDIWSARVTLPTLVLLGSEGSGLPPDVVAASDLAVRIPMEGRASSLNLAVAAGVILYELKRRSPV